MGLFFVLPLAALALEAFAEGGGAWARLYANPLLPGALRNTLALGLTAGACRRWWGRRWPWNWRASPRPQALDDHAAGHAAGVFGAGHRLRFHSWLWPGGLRHAVDGRRGADPARSAPGSLQRDRSGIRLCLLPGAARGLVAVPGFRQPGPAAHAGGAYPGATALARLPRHGAGAGGPVGAGQCLPGRGDCHGDLWHGAGSGGHAAEYPR